MYVCVCNIQSSYLCFSNEYFSLKRDTTPFVDSTGNLTSDGTPATKLNRTRMKAFKRVSTPTTRIEPNRQNEIYCISYVANRLSRAIITEKHSFIFLFFYARENFTSFYNVQYFQ